MNPPLKPEAPADHGAHQIDGDPFNGKVAPPAGRQHEDLEDSRTGVNSQKSSEEEDHLLPGDDPQNIPTQ